MSSEGKPTSSSNDTSGLSAQPSKTSSTSVSRQQVTSQNGGGSIQLLSYSPKPRDDISTKTGNTNLALSTTDVTVDLSTVSDVTADDNHNEKLTSQKSPSTSGSTAGDKASNSGASSEDDHVTLEVGGAMEQQVSAVEDPRDIDMSIVFVPHMVFSCLAMWCCGCIFGCFGFWFAVASAHYSEKGNEKKAKNFSITSLVFAFTGFATGLIVIIILLLMSLEVF